MDEEVAVMSENRMHRRSFLGRTAAAAVAIASPRVFGAPKFVPASERIRVGYCGVGTQGIRNLIEALPHPAIQIVAIADPNRASNDYPEWGKNEIRDRIRKFLDDPAYGEGVVGCRCGREVGMEIARRHYASRGLPAPKAYVDYREMLEKEDLDAVYVMTPEHLHGTILLAGMRRGKHVVTHKPVANVLREVHLAVDTAKETGVATHLFCAAGQGSTSQICEWIWAGAIGPVREVHNWSTRPFWPQGMTELPKETPPVPDGFVWDLWLGPVPHRPYHPAYTHAVFRGWYDFGTGALGDMGHYSFFQIFKVLKLGHPLAVDASRSQFWKIEDLRWVKQVNRISYPRASWIRWEFAAREDMPPVTLHWYDGGIRPPLPRELEIDGLPMPDEGMLFVGDKGKILADFTGGNPRLIPKSAMQAFKQPPESVPRPAGELDQWVRACQGGPPSDASFPRVAPFAETILLGTIALRVDKKLRWDAAKREFPDSPEANALMRRTYREGWEL
ncbi:MAG: Gfo/Idh/MocA family oxidoreductase [Planctomycetes bacterium]|nr:Gfo/Idh/MocA family oxidoreductase [Planctomycetota bacterium]